MIAGVVLMMVAGCLALPESSNVTEIIGIRKREADDWNENCLKTIISNNGDTTKFSFELNHPAAKVTRCESEYGETESWTIEPLESDNYDQRSNINTGSKWINEGKALSKVIKQFERKMDLLVETVTTKLEERIEEIVPAKKKPETKMVVGGYKPMWNLSNRYKMHTVGMTWAEAKITCEEEGAHLLVINSPEERNVVPTLFSQSPAIRCANWVNWAWIGVHDNHGEKDFWTVQGERLSYIGYANWYPGRPAYSTAENCVTVDKNGAMYDSRCGATAPFICEM